MVLGERGAHGGDDVAEAGLPRANHVHVAFDDDDRAGLTDSFVGEVKAEEGAAFVEELRLRGVKVLGLFALETAPAHGDVQAPFIGDWDDGAAAETVVGVARGLGFDEEAGGDDVPFGIAAAVEVVAEGTPIVWRPADAEGLDGFWRDAALAFDVSTGGGAAWLLVLALVEIDGGGHDCAELVGAASAGGGFGGELDTGLAGEKPERAAEIQIFALLDEAEEVAAFAAAPEAAPGGAVREDVEGGCLLLVEGTEGAEVSAGFVKRCHAADVFDQVDLAFDFGDGVHGHGVSG